jgi:site-specific DNA-cytosine methylase
MGALMATDYKQPKQLVERISGCFECECKYAIEEPKAYKIRKLTPLECWRLMGISDEDFYKAKQFNSDSQLYKQAGNGIVVPVLEGIFKELFK